VIAWPTIFVSRLTTPAPWGLTRAEMSKEVFGRNRSSREIAQALGLLQELGLAWCEVDRSGAGRPVERWRSKLTNKTNSDHG
jgi:hypothetical protein